MTERVRQRTSKWDLEEDPANYSIESRRIDPSSRIGNEPVHDSGAKQEWNSSKNTGFRNSKWADNNSKRYEDNSRMSYRETPAGSRDEYKDDYVSREFNEAHTTRGWDGNKSYSTSMSPGPDDWTRRSRSRSPRRSWSRSHRSRSRSRSRSPIYRPRSRSRSPRYGPRSRSRTPPHGLKREPEGWNERTGARSRVPLCNNFARGRCTRGSQCRFLHEENDGYKDGRHSGSDPAENWGNRRERESSYGYSNKAERDYSGDRLSHGHESQRNNRSSGICINFVKGICHRGSSCRFLHEDSIVNGRSTDERTHEGERKPGPGHDYRRESSRFNTPCRYFASGKCRMGTECRFSHEGAAHDRSEGGPVDDRWGNSASVQNKSWADPKWNDEASDPADGTAGGKSLDCGPGRVLTTSWDNSSWNNRSVGQTWNDTAAVNGTSEARSVDQTWNDTSWNDSSRSNKSVGQTWNDTAAVNGTSEARSADEKWGNNVGDGDKVWGGPKWGNEVSVSANGTVAGRTPSDKTSGATTSGWDEAAPYNQFPGPVGNQKVADDRPEGRLMDEKVCYNLVDKNRMREGPKLPDEAPETAHVSVEGKLVIDGSGCISDDKTDDLGCNKRVVGMTWNGKAANSEVKRFSRWGNDNNTVQIGDDADVKELVSGTKMGGNVAELEKNDNDVKDAVTISEPAQGSLDDSMNLDNHNRAWGFPTWSDRPSDQNMHKSPWASDTRSASLDAQSSRGHEEMLNFKKTHAADVKEQYTHFTDKKNPRYGTPDPLSKPQHVHTSIQGNHTVSVYPDSQMHPASKITMHPSASNVNAQSQIQELNILSHEQTSVQGSHTVPVYPDGQVHPASNIMMHPSSSNVYAQSQQASLPSPRVRSFDLNGPFEDLHSPNNQIQNTAETVKASGSTDPKGPHATPGAPASQNVVTSEQVAQMSHLSASLAQIFGNPQKLPQLYATLNSTNALGLMHPGPISGGSGASVGGSFVQSNPDNWSQKQHHPVSNSMQSTPVFSEMPKVQNNAHANLAAPVAATPTVKEPGNSDNVERKHHEQSHNPKQTENVTPVASVAKEQDNADGRMDEDGKKGGKDAKGMRMFKFSLVEIIKEILKPTWKEGQLSKEAHKTIVKKVVDKVSGSVQGEHIQTQDKIDQYLAYSKNKLTKLVEAYVEKYLKG